MPLLPLALLFAALPQVPAAQPASAPAQNATQPTAALPAAPPPSTTLQPAVESLRATLILVRVEKWKAPAPIRDAAGTNLDSIQRDLDSTLPPLVKAADATPNSVTALLPVFRNINALYDVLLRVSNAAELTAPRPQADGLQKSLAALDQARRTLGDSIQTDATAQDKQITSLRAQLATALATPAPAPPPPPPAPTKPKPKKKKPTPKPAATPTT
ncbi:hypothetical protein [Granulicella tundricola]|nr:hypothetical protein [Granulicella tundricola]